MEDYAKMLFAAEMHKLAIEYYRDAKRKFLKTAEEVNGEFVGVAEWQQANPMEKFVALALSEVQATAKELDRLTLGQKPDGDAKANMWTSPSRVEAE
jgi:hypothetical protein